MRTIVLVLVFFVLTLGGCSNKENITANARGDRERVTEEIQLLEPISTSQVFEKVTYGDINKMQIFDGYVRPVVEEVTFQREGFLQEILVVVGDEVKEGQLLGRLDDEWFIKEIESKKETLQELEGTYVLNKSNIESTIKQKAEEKKVAQDSDNPSLVIQLDYDIKLLKEDLEALKKLYEVDKKSNQDGLDRAKSQVGKNTIVAPYAGTVIGVAGLKEGDYVGEDFAVVGIASNDTSIVNSEFIIYSEIKNSQEYFFIKDSKKYELNYIPYDAEEFAALQLRGEKPISTFEFTKNYDEVNQGDYGLVCLIEDRREHVLHVPIDCVLKDKTGSYVYVLDNGNKTKRYVITGLTDARVIEIVDGLVEGDMVYVEY